MNILIFINSIDSAILLPTRGEAVMSVAQREGRTVSESPFHSGEQRVQTRLGVRESIEPWARKVVRSYLPAEHRAFCAELPYLIAAGRDERGRPWATLLPGAPGFIHSPDDETLVIEGGPVEGDALHDRLVPGADLGLLGIELATRRRNRVNGRVRASGGDGIVFAVDQSFGNCPQYISEREWCAVPDASRTPTRTRTDRLSPELAARVRRADTFFIATGHREEGDDARFGMDASHRGGAPGFVEVEDDRTLVIPDYAGNNHFNTIGNLVMDPRAGLLFVDFESGGLLQLTGRAEIDWDSQALDRYPGAQRLIRFVLEEAIALEEALPLRWVPSRESARELLLVEKTRESADVVSFVFEDIDGRPLPDFSPGQHLPIEVTLPGDHEPTSRTYSLSNAPSEDRYRISVKREAQGRVSRHLHDAVEVGARLQIRPPAGDFKLRSSKRPVVLVSAGVGVTPMLSMLHALADGPEAPPVSFVHGARDGAHHALAREVRELADSAANVRTHVSFSRPRGEDLEGRDFDATGRVSGALIERVVPDLDADFYLCGPVLFMAVVQTELEELGVRSDRIHSESFGPSGVPGSSR
jgi:ferredoxin-NADP reductase/predicted pyridoxine 5'-phosphate oxidase superfamily flavin-nucleotide-binding protein